MPADAKNTYYWSLEYYNESLEMLKNTFNEETAKHVIKLITVDKGTYAFISSGALDVYTEYLLLWGGFNDPTATNTTQARKKVFDLIDQFKIEFYQDEEGNHLFVGPPYNAGFKKLSFLHVETIKSELSVLSKESIEYYISHDYDALVKSLACTESCETWNLTKWHNEKRMSAEARWRDERVVLLQHLKARMNDPKKSRIIYDDIMEKTLPLNMLADATSLQSYISDVDTGYYDNYPDLLSRASVQSEMGDDKLLLALMIIAPALLLLYLIVKFARPCAERCLNHYENTGSQLRRFSVFNNYATRVGLQSGGTVVYSQVADSSDEDSDNDDRMTRAASLVG